MNKLNIKVIALAVGLAFSAGAAAEVMSKNEYAASKDRIAAQYKVAKAGCASLSGNSNDLCVAEASGREKVAMADLEAAYKPSVKSRYKARVAKAEAEYAMAKERCDDTAGNAKDVCVKEAKSEQASAKADAKARMKTSDANDTAADKSADARREAATSKRNAEYEVAKEKCDIYAGGAKDHCIDQANVRFGKD